MKTIRHSYTDLTLLNFLPRMWYDAWGKLEPPVWPLAARVFYAMLAVVLVCGALLLVLR